MPGIFDLDNPLTTQRIFRNVMNSFAYPFRLYSIADGSYGDNSTQDYDIYIKGLCGVFLDSEVSFYMHGDDNLAAGIRAETYAKPATLEEADFVIIINDFHINLLEKVSAGSLVNPHKGATVIIAAPQLSGDIKITVEGPGINGKAAHFVHPRIAECLDKVAEMQIEYPKGFELVFISRQGEINSVPRHVKICKGEIS